VSYNSSDESVATISGNTLTIVGAGSATITASQEGNENYNSALPVEQPLEVMAVSAIQSITPANISFYPNPASYHITIQSAVIIDRVEILDMSGNQISIQLQGMQIDISRLKADIYILKVYTADTVFVGKFIKSK
ncbi:MAG: T9SS type A sorting domain-containing protein, partial [Bacteroidales bacterium]